MYCYPGWASWSLEKLHILSKKLLQRPHDHWLFFPEIMYAQSLQTCLVYIIFTWFSFWHVHGGLLQAHLACHLVYLSSEKLESVIFPDSSDGKESACSAGDPGLIPELGRSPGEGNGYSLQYSCLENSMDRGAWCTIVHGVTESYTTEKLTLSISTKSEFANEMSVACMKTRTPKFFPFWLEMGLMG